MQKSLRFTLQIMLDKSTAWISWSRQRKKFAYGSRPGVATSKFQTVACIILNDCLDDECYRETHNDGHFESSYAATHSLAALRRYSRLFKQGIHAPAHLSQNYPAKWNPRFAVMANIIQSQKNDEDRNNLFANA